MKRFDTASETINELRRSGYSIDFNSGKAFEKDLNEKLRMHPEEFRIDHAFRFEGDSDPADEMVVYSISSNDGKYKGILVNGYGIYSDPRSTELIDHLRRTHVWLKKQAV